MKTLYTKIENSKTGLAIPFIGNQALCSRYDPQKEGKTFADQCSKESRFFVIAGLAGGYHIKNLLEQNKDRKIIVIENFLEDFDFLLKIPACKELLSDRRVIISTPETLFKSIIDNYLPSFYGSLNLVFLRVWETLFQKNCEMIREIVNKALKTVQADFSVQSHFGKIWQKNIIENLKIASQITNSNQCLDFIKELSSKKAIIIAAGPSLDKNLKLLKDKSKSFCIISTDTAFPVLLKNSIIPQAVVSLDGQMISHCHFLEDLEKCKETVFFADLCSNSSISKKLFKLKKNLVFFSSGHPLSVLASSFCGNNFLKLNSGSGTVTIAATDLAFNCGFLQIEFLGADFAYLNGKPYAKGTYLDNLYQKDAIRIFTTETQFTNLLFRGKTKKISENSYTTLVLENYKLSLEFFLSSKKEKFTQKLSNFDYLVFKKEINKQILLLPQNFLDCLKNPFFLTLLPLMAFYQKKHSITESYKLARENALRYT